LLADDLVDFHPSDKNPPPGIRDLSASTSETIGSGFSPEAYFAGGGVNPSRL
jgi:hypothetical protein